MYALNIRTLDNHDLCSECTVIKRIMYEIGHPRRHSNNLTKLTNNLSNVGALI
jgi:hypothetical protein